MSDSNGEIASQRVTKRARVEEAVTRCAEAKAHGDTISKEELLTWFAIRYPQYGTKRDFDRIDLLFASMKADFDAMLLSAHKMAVECERGGKWRIVLPSEQADFATRTARDAFRRGFTKAQAVTSNVDVARLNDAERAKLDDTSARLASIEMFARKNIPQRLADGRGGK